MPSCPTMATSRPRKPAIQPLSGSPSVVRWPEITMPKSGKPEELGDCRNRARTRRDGRHQRQQQHADQGAEEGSGGGEPHGATRMPRAGEREAVERGGGIGGRAGDVEQDRRAASRHRSRPHRCRSGRGSRRSAGMRKVSVVRSATPRVAVSPGSAPTVMPEQRRPEDIEKAPRAQGEVGDRGEEIDGARRTTRSSGQADEEDRLEDVGHHCRASRPRRPAPTSAAAASAAARQSPTRRSG